MKKIVIVAGPTASGKSDVAVRLAKKYNGEIISCDSMQIYKGLDVGTAKISEQEKQGVKHYMIDVAEPSQEYSVFDYAEGAKAAIEQITSQGKLPIVVGGTGLYAESLIYPLNFAVNKDEAVRERLKEELARDGAEKLHERLAMYDPEDAAKIHPNNTKRLIRALEIIEISGEAKRKTELRKPQYDVCMIVLDLPRDELYKRIDSRVERMFAQGLEAEVRGIIANGFADENSQSMQAIGYKEFFPYFNGVISADDVRSQIKQNSRRYAKRQISWFKRYKFAFRANPRDEKAIDEKIDEFLRG